MDVSVAATLVTIVANPSAGPFVTDVACNTVLVSLPDVATVTTVALAANFTWKFTVNGYIFIR